MVTPSTLPFRPLSLRLWVFPCLVLALLAGISASAQSVLLTIDYSDLSAVKVTATGNFSAITYPDTGTGNYSFAEGISLQGFFTSSVVVQDFANTRVSSSLTDSADSYTLAKGFTEMSAWNDDHTEYWSSYGVTGTGSGIDLTLWSNNASSSDKMNFSTTGAAFYGEAVFDLTSYSSYTSLFPALNATGDIRIWNNDGGLGNAVLGTWQIVGAAVPEPSTYAAIFGSLALLGTMVIRRRQPGRL